MIGPAHHLIERLGAADRPRQLFPYTTRSRRHPTTLRPHDPELTNTAPTSVGLVDARVWPEFELDEGHRCALEAAAHAERALVRRQVTVDVDAEWHEQFGIGDGDRRSESRTPNCAVILPARSAGRPGGARVSRRPGHRSERQLSATNSGATTTPGPTIHRLRRAARRAAQARRSRPPLRRGARRTWFALLDQSFLIELPQALLIQLRPIPRRLQWVAPCAGRRLRATAMLAPTFACPGGGFSRMSLGCLCDSGGRARRGAAQA